MKHQIITAIFLVAAGLLMFRVRGWTHRWIGFMLVSAGLSSASAALPKQASNTAYILWVMMLCIFCLVAIFEEPDKKS